MFTCNFKGSIFIAIFQLFIHHTNIADYYTPKYAIWAFEQFDWFTLTILWLHITLIYLLWRVQVAHIAWIYLFGGFDWFVSSLWPTAVLQVDAAQLTLLAVCCSFHKQWPKQFKFLLLSYLSSFVFVFKLHWFSLYFQEVHQLAHAN